MYISCCPWIRKSISVINKGRHPRTKQFGKVKGQQNNNQLYNKTYIPHLNCHAVTIVGAIKRSLKKATTLSCRFVVYKVYFR